MDDSSKAAIARPVIKSTCIRDVSFGEGVVVVEPCNLYECVIDDGCFIGPFVEIQRGVHIGKNCKIQSHSFVCELVTIGDECVVAHGVVFINDLYRSGRPAHGNKALWRETIIGSYVLIGSNCTILPVRICDRVTVGAGSVVTRDILEPGIYAGNPARKLRSL